MWQASGAYRANVATELRAQALGRVRATPNMDKAFVVLTTGFLSPSHAVSTPTAPGLYAVTTRSADQSTGEVGKFLALPHVWVAGE